MQNQPIISQFQQEEPNVNEQVEQNIQEMTMNELEQFQIDTGNNDQEEIELQEEEENQEMEQPYPYRRMVGRTPRRAAAVKFTELLKSSSKKH